MQLLSHLQLQDQLGAVFSGKNALTYRDDGALGVFGLNDDIPIHLQPGENELLVPVTEYNGGWAFECELHPVPVGLNDGIRMRMSSWTDS